MGATLSRGATTLRGWISSYLQATMPTLVAKARVDWSLEDWQLPLPLKYDMYDMDTVGANMYPAIGADFANETNNVRTDFTEAAEPEYWRNYSGNVYVWTATPREPANPLAVPEPTPERLEEPYRETCMRVRDDLAELVRQALLVKPSLGQGPDTCWLEESAVNTTKQTAVRADRNRPDWIAGAIISVVYRMKSELWIPPIATADTIVVDTGKLVP